MKQNTCKQCKKVFMCRTSLQPFCSKVCFNNNQTKRKPLKCKCCGNMFDPWGLYPMKYCSRACFFETSKKTRIGKENPAYRNGNRAGGKNDFDSSTTQKYRKEFLSKTSYPYCEVCSINQSPRWEVHHIIFRSEKPNHKYIHDNRNLIHLCISCHNSFHSSGGKEKRLTIVKERGLVELFGKDIL